VALTEARDLAGKIPALMLSQFFALIKSGGQAAPQSGDSSTNRTSLREFSIGNRSNDF
jgi:hypothetical protein